MSIDVNAQTGRILFKRGGTQTTWDSNDRNMLLTNAIQTTYPIAAVNTFGKLDPVERTETRVLATVHPLANVFMGLHVVAGIPRTLGGTRIVFRGFENMDPRGIYATYLTGDAQLADCIWLHYMIENSQFKVVINYRFPADAVNEFPGDTVRVTAWFGTFDY